MVVFLPVDGSGLPTLIVVLFGTPRSASCSGTPTAREGV